MLHPDRRRVRHPRSARRLRFDDDRPDAVAGILHQQGLAGRRRRRRRVAGAAGAAATALRPAAAPHARRREADGAQGQQAIAIQCHRARAGDGVSVSADRHSRHLFLQRLAPGHGVGRLVAALVFRVLQRSRDAGCGMDEPSCRRGISHDRNAARHAGGGRAGPRRALPGPVAVVRHALCAAGDAGGDLGAFPAVAVRGAERGARLLDGDDRPHHADDVLRHRGGAVAPRLARPQPRGGRDGSRLRSGAGVSSRNAAADHPGDCRRLDAGLHALARRRRDRELHHRSGFGDAADPDLFRGAAGREARDQRDLHHGDRADCGDHRDRLARLETVELARRERGAAYSRITTSPRLPSVPPPYSA